MTNIHWLHEEVDSEFLSTFKHTLDEIMAKTNGKFSYFDMPNNVFLLIDQYLRNSKSNGGYDEWPECWHCS